MLGIGNLKTDLKSLGRDLRAFGLNPTDWQVVRENSKTYKVKSLQDRSFVLKGCAHRKGFRLAWQKLELESI